MNGSPLAAVDFLAEGQDPSCLVLDPNRFGTAACAQLVEGQPSCGASPQQSNRRGLFPNSKTRKPLFVKYFQKSAFDS